MANETTAAAFSTAGLVEELWRDEIALEYDRQAIQLPFWNVTDWFQPGANVATIPIVKNLASGMTTISDETTDTPTYQAAVVDGVQVTLDTFKDIAAKFSVQWAEIFQQKYRAEISKKMVLKVQQDFLDALLTAANSASAFSPNTDLIGTLWDKTDDDVMEVLTYADLALNQNDVPQDGRFWVLNYVMHQRLHKLYQNRDYAGELYPWLKGLNGNEGVNGPGLLGYPVYLVRSLPTESISGTTRDIAMLCHGKAIAYANRGIQSFISPEDANFRMGKVRMKTAYGIDSIPDDGTSNNGIYPFALTQVTVS